MHLPRQDFLFSERISHDPSLHGFDDLWRAYSARAARPLAVFHVASILKQFNTPMNKSSADSEWLEQPEDLPSFDFALMKRNYCDTVFFVCPLHDNALTEAANFLFVSHTKTIRQNPYVKTPMR